MLLDNIQNTLTKVRYVLGQFDLEEQFIDPTAGLRDGEINKDLVWAGSLSELAGIESLLSSSIEAEDFLTAIPVAHQAEGVIAFIEQQAENRLAA